MLVDGAIFGAKIMATRLIGVEISTNDDLLIKLQFYSSNEGVLRLYPPPPQSVSNLLIASENGRFYSFISGRGTDLVNY